MGAVRLECVTFIDTQGIEVVRQEFDAEVATLREFAEGDEVALLEQVAADEEDYATTGFEMADLFLAGEREAGLDKMKVFDAKPTSL